MSAIDGGVVVVTGASSGIGRELAREIAPRARAVVLMARRRDRLEVLAAELRSLNAALIVVLEAVDVTDERAVDEAFARVEREVGPVDVLVNNAGFGDMGVFDRADWKKTRQMIDVNVTALTYLTHRVVAGMVARGRGGIINVSSGFGLSFGPGFAAYVGTKHYVTGFTESLRLDLAGTGVVVTQVCPGPVRTEFAEVAGNFTGRDAPAFVEIDAATCARATIRGFDRRRALIIPGFVIRVLLALGAMTPRFVLRALYAPLARKLRSVQAKARALPPAA